MVEAAFFGANFEGYVPARGALKEKSALQQFVELTKVWEFSSVDFMAEVSLNRKAIYLNAWFWVQHDCSDRGIRLDEKRLMFERLEYAWQNSRIEIPWPAEELSRALSLSGSEDDPAPGRWRNAMSRAGGRVDNVEIEEQLAAQQEFREVIQAETTKRPMGVSIVAIGMFLWAAFYVTLTIIAIARPVLLGAGSGEREAAAEVAVMVPFLLLARIGLYIAFGVGLWSMKRWARKSVVFWSLVIVLLNVLSWRGLNVFRAIEIILCIVVVGYMSSRRVSAAFETSIQADP